MCGELVNSSSPSVSPQPLKQALLWIVSEGRRDRGALGKLANLDRHPDLERTKRLCREPDNQGIALAPLRGFVRQHGESNAHVSDRVVIALRLRLAQLAGH